MCNVNKIKSINSYSFDCSIDANKIDKNYHDEWGCAFAWIEDKDIGVEYNLCYDKEESCSAIYKSGTDSEGHLSTDYSSSIHYEIDFAKDNWKNELETAMIKAMIQFFPDIMEG